MSYYNSASKEAILYYSQLMAGTWGYKPNTYAQRMGWLDDQLKVTEKGHKLAMWILSNDANFKASRED